MTSTLATRAESETLRAVVGFAAVVAPVLHSINDALEWYQQGFSTTQLWLNYVAFLPMPWFLLDVYAVHENRLRDAGLYGDFSMAQHLLTLRTRRCMHSLNRHRRATPAKTLMLRAPTETPVSSAQRRRRMSRDPTILPACGAVRISNLNASIVIPGNLNLRGRPVR